MNPPPTTTCLNLYNPAGLDAGRLLAEFVDRNGLLERMLGIIRDNTPDRPQQHLVVIGARGLGKTMLLCALRHRVNGDAVLAAEWLPVSFYEEQYGIGDLADFWLEAIRHLETALDLPPRIAGELLDQPGDDLAERAEARFFELLATSGKRALLLIDNLNEILAAIQAEDSLHRLRALLMEDTRLMLIGTATSYFDEITDVGRPFHDFFRILVLERLNQAQMDAVLCSLAAANQDTVMREILQKSPERVQALRILTGGNPRLVRLGYRILRDGLEGDVRHDLEQLLDECTPFFKHRIETLAKEGRRVFDAIARRWDPVTVDDLKKELRKPSNYISAQIKRLIDDGFVEEASGTEKKKRYQVAERFYNVYYLMRYSREGREKLRWLVAFMKAFYTSRDYHDWDKQLERDLSSSLTPTRRDEKLGQLYTLMAAAEDWDDRRVTFEVVVRQAIAEDDHRLIEQAVQGDPIEWLSSNYLVADLLWLLDRETRQRFGFCPREVDWYRRLGQLLRERNLLQAAEARMARLGIFQLETARHADLAGQMLGWVLGRLDEAEAAFRRAIALDPKNPNSMNYLGIVLCYQGRYQEAETAFRQSLEIAASLEINTRTNSVIWNNLAYLFAHQGRYQEAEATLRRALDMDPQQALALRNLGNTLFSQHRYTDAESAYRQAIKIDPQFASPWNGLGNALVEQGRYQEAEAAYREGSRLDPYDGTIPTNLAELYLDHTDRHQEGAQALLRGVELDPAYAYAGCLFNQHWRVVLPTFAARIAAAPEQEPLRQFVLEQLMVCAQFGDRVDVLAALQALEPLPQQIFEPLILALRALEDRSVLYQIAREKRDLVLNVMARLAGHDRSPASDVSLAA